MRHGHDGDRPDVSVAGASDRDGWHFTVSDSGPGVAPADAPRIFELFGRAAGEQRPGTGIGLTPCKTVVEAHGRRIWVGSERGRGAAFHFTLR
jgi:signal transduction histidine kinase